MTNLIFFGKHYPMTCKIDLIQHIENTLAQKVTISTFSLDSAEKIVAPTELLDKAKYKCIKQTIDKIYPEFNINDYTYDHMGIKSGNRLLLSISHTKNYGVILLAKKEDYLSVGIDLEFSNRSINPNTKKFFLNPNEDSQNLLDIWTQKEAAFKASSPLSSGCKLLTDILINNQTFTLKGFPELNGDIITFKRKIDQQNFTISVATIKKTLPTSHPLS